MAQPPVLHVIYAGRGDCMILECDVPNNLGVRQHILVDGGPRYYSSGPFNGGDAPYYRYLASTIRRLLGPNQPITQVIISHPDEDHYGGYRPIVTNNQPATLRLFLPENSWILDDASEPVLDGLIPPLVKYTAPANDWLFPPVKGIFPLRQSIQYYYNPTAIQGGGGTDTAVYNFGLDRNDRSILMYTREGGQNERPIFFTGDGNATAIAQKMEAEFPNQQARQFAIYKIQHHGSLEDNAIRYPNTIKYDEHVWQEAFVLELCRLLLDPGLLGVQNQTVIAAAQLAEQKITMHSTVQNYYNALIPRRRTMQTSVEDQAYLVNQNGQRDIVRIESPAAANTLRPVPWDLYEELEDELVLTGEAYLRDWWRFRDAAVAKYKEDWQQVNRVREFYSRFQADVYVVSANHTYHHPRPEVLLGLAIAVRRQQRTARLYLTSGYSVDVVRLQKLVQDLCLDATAEQLFCGNNLTLWYLSVGPYMSIDGNSNSWNTATNERDRDKVTRPLVFTDQQWIDRLDSKFEDHFDEADVVMRRLTKCRIKVISTQQDVYPTYSNLGVLDWNITTINTPFSGNTFFWVDLNDFLALQTDGRFSSLTFYASEVSPAPYSFKYAFGGVANGRSQWAWRNAWETQTVCPDAQHGARIDILATAQPQPLAVYIERVFDHAMMMMVTPELILPQAMAIKAEVPEEEAVSTTVLPVRPRPIETEVDPTSSRQALEAPPAAPGTSPVLPQSLQQVLADVRGPFTGVDTADLLDLLKYLFQVGDNTGDNSLLKQTLDQMPQMILQAGFVDLDVNVVKSTAVTTVNPVLDQVISSATLVCQTTPTSTVQWPAKMEIAGLSLSLDQITITVSNCRTKQAAMIVESAVTLSSSNKTVLQLGMAWASSDAMSDSGPIISFKAGVDSVSDLVKALSDSASDLKGILEGQIPLVSKSSGAEAPTLDNPAAPIHELGFSVCQPVRATAKYEIFSVWIKTEITGWSSYLPVPAKFDKIVAKALVQVIHPFQSAERAVGGTVRIDIPIPPAKGDLQKKGRSLAAQLSAIPYPAPGGYDYRFRILGSIEGVSLHDVARVAQEFFGVDDFTSGVTGTLPGFAKVVDMIRVRELGFTVGNTKESGWSFDEWVVELSIPSFEILPGMLSLVNSYVRVQRFYQDGVSVSGEAIFQSQKHKNQQAIVNFALPTLGVEGHISFKAPGGLSLKDLFEAFDLGQVSQVPVLSDIAAVEVISCEVKFVRPKGGGLSISSFSTELRKFELKVGVLDFEDLEFELKWQKAQQDRDPKEKDGQVAPAKPISPEPASSFVTVNFSTTLSSIDSVIQVVYDGEKKALTGSLSSLLDSPVSLGQILQVPIPGSGKAGSQDDDATGSFLTAYFDQDSVDALAKILDGIKIRSFGAEYGKSSDGSSFALKGVLGLGPVDLSLNFTSGSKKPPAKKDDKITEDKNPPTDQEVASQQTWSFDAQLMLPESTTTPALPDVVTLGDLIGGIMGNESKDSLPPFVNNIQFKRPKSQNQLSVIFQKLLPEQKDATSSIPGKDKVPSPAHFVFSMIINVFGFSFSYTQCQEGSVTTASSDTSSDKAKPAPKPTKRIVSASLNDIPDIEIPLIGAVPKPVDQILYLWVQDTSETTESKTTDAKSQKATLRGLTYGEVQAINKVRGSKVAPLVFKKTQQKLEDSTVVLAAGHHFMMTGKDALGNTTVILDYVFGSTSSPASSKKPVSAKDSETPVPSTPAASDDANAKPPGLAPYKKSAGPLSISNIGFGWKGTPKDGTLSIVFDASVLIGPIGFGLLGFKLEFPITERTSLQNLPAPKVTVDGLAASFNKPPLTISGAFMHKVVDGDDMYAGALLIGYNVYLFQAAGFYGEVTDPATNKKFKSAFMFCRVNGPLMSVGWAELSGLVAGLGYNSSIRMPSAAEIPTFPLIAPLKSSDPMDSLKDLMDPRGGVITSKMDSFWVAAGVKVTAFQVLKVDAVLVLSFDPSVKIGIFGLAVADLPPAPGGSGPGKFVHVELGLSATVDVALGVMKIEGQLTPASYVLDPNCHLTGGFAMYSWFDSPDPDLRGDWVFTIGGYHRAFKPPAHYPVPPRLGISWSFSRYISITGEAYFAVTPKMCMGGGRLDVTLRAGPLRAWFNAYADFLINYKPFHFIAEGGVSVGVECVIDFCIASITIGATLGATLYLEGPPLSGRITVDFWVTTFNVNFGRSPDPAPELNLSEFFHLVLQGGQTQGMLGAAAGSTTDGKPGAELHVFSCQSGLVPTGKSETQPDAPWVVRGAAFAFNVSCLFAIVNCTVVTAVKKDDAATDENSKTLSWGNEGQQQSPYPKPMKRTVPLMSDVEIRIYRRVPATAEAFIADVGVQDDDFDGWDKVQRVIRPLSSAIWGRYDSSTDPSRHDADQKAMLSAADGTVNLMTGVDIHGPDAKLSSESPIEFSVAEAMGMNATLPDPIPTFPDIVTPEDSNLLQPVPPGANWEDDSTFIKGQWKAKEGVARDVLALWTKSIAAFSQWDATGSPLQAGAPAETIRRFDDLYLTMPWLTGVA